MADNDGPEDLVDNLNAEATLGTSPDAASLHPTNDEEDAPDNGSVPNIDGSYYIIGFVTPPTRHARSVRGERTVNRTGQLPLLWDPPEPTGHAASAAERVHNTTEVHVTTLESSAPEEVTRRAISNRVRRPPLETPENLSAPFLTIRHDHIRLQRPRHSMPSHHPLDVCHELFRGFVLESGPDLVGREQWRADARALLTTRERPDMHPRVLDALVTIASDGYPYASGLARNALLDEVQSMRAMSPEPDSYSSQLMAVISQTLIWELEDRDPDFPMFQPTRNLFTAPDSTVSARPEGIAIDLRDNDASYAARRQQREWAAAAFPEYPSSEDGISTIHVTSPAPPAHTRGRDYRSNAEIIQDEEDLEDEYELGGYDLGLYNLQGLALSVNVDQVLEAQEELWEEHERWCSAVDWCREERH
ncbi:hypothetical protein LTR91_021605 [Friedmanniomyces endolithicus]|uniref:Uncharacterized protein n=1 Tax=Friedmanniomyces endolithicus TaxID=329885 RepID=A0AAN6K027_9PEZI|nr:hypothetical protein LTR91_021605 [Friedmanniomyces endolithicus]